MSIDNFIYTWKASSYDEIQCIDRDANGNPTYLKFLRKGKLILEIFIKYDDNGNWTMIWSEKPKEEKPKEAKKK